MSKGSVSTADRLVPDELWEAVEPLLPEHPPSKKGGRPRLSDRKCLAGIIFVLRHGIGWEHLPQELGCGSGMTCWRRLREWQEAGVWQQLHEVMLAKLNNAGLLDFSRVMVDGAIVKAPSGGKKQARTRRTGGSAAPSGTC